MPSNLNWTHEREEFYRSRPNTSINALVARSETLSQDSTDSIDAEARGAIIPHKFSETQKQEQFVKTTKDLVPIRR